MAGFDNLYITTAGAQLAAKTIEGKQLVFTVARLGSGTLSDSSREAIRKRTTMVKTAMEVQIRKAKVTSGTEAIINFIVKNTDASSAFYWRELGIFALDPDTKVETLFAYGYAGNNAEYVNNSVSEIVQKDMNIVVTVDSASNVSVVLDGSQVYVTENEMNEAISEAITKKGNVYGIRRKVNDNTSTNWERLDDNVGKVANATKNGTPVQNDFDNLYPWSDIISYNYDVENKKIKAYYGDPTFSFTGSNGEVLTRIPEFYWQRFIKDGYEYIYIADYNKAGFKKSEEFSIGRYDACIDEDGTLHSYSGYSPSTNKTIAQHRTAAKALGNEFCQLDYHYFLIQMLYLVEYANTNSQNKLGNGISGMRYSADDKAIIAGTNTNTIVIAKSTNFIVGQQVDIGTAVDGRTIAQDRTITSIDDYSSGTTEGTAITFDGDAVNIAVGNILHSCGQKSGHCDELGMLSGCLNNDSKHGMIYRGIENIIGNVFNWVDGINIKDYQAYICYTPEEYVSDKFEDPYEKLGYVNSNTNNSYVKTTGYDEKHPLVALPIEVGAGSSSGYCDYYTCSEGNRVARVGGNFRNGASGGLWYWYCYSASSDTHLTFGARLLKYQ